MIFGAGWVLLRSSTGIWAFSGLIGSACAVVTVICTAYIYRSLKPVPRWPNHWVAPNYLTLSALTGALLLVVMAGLFGYGLPGGRVIALVAIAVTLLAKTAYWQFIDNEPVTSTAESATGLGALGKVRQFEAPHASENYLLKEMGYRVAHKHLKKLRIIAIVCGFVLLFLVGGDRACNVRCYCGDLLAVRGDIELIGVLTERWLFFAEAKHVVTRYYGSSLDAPQRAFQILLELRGRARVAAQRKLLLQPDWAVP